MVGDYRISDSFCIKCSLRLGPRVRRYLAIFFRVYSIWHFLAACLAKHVTLGREKLLVSKVCNDLYII